jgi:MFS transporter, FSR family, fosmidomycin resistance protein
MSQISEMLRARSAPHVRVVGAVSAAHFMSHYYMLLLAPLLPFVRAEYGVSYTEIGFAFTAFNGVTAALQTPAGFVVDRLGARILLIAGLAIGASAFILVGLIHSFWAMVALFALAGVSNAIYHPADYAMLSQQVPSDRIGQSFSVHTFAGMLGGAVAPPTLLAMQSLWGWRGAFIGAGLIGFAVAALLLALRDGADVRTVTPARKADDASTVGWRVLVSPPILLNMVFFVLLAMMSGGIWNYSVVALGALYATPVSVANYALSAFLLLSAIGVLAGGLLVGRTARHGPVVTLSLAAIAASTLLIGEIDLGTLALIAAMTVSGFFFGLMMPSRDMIVREVTPPGSFGKVFGFVTSGFSIGGIVSPLIFGAIMDHGSPKLVFLAVAACSLVAIASVKVPSKRPA